MPKIKQYVCTNYQTNAPFNNYLVDAQWQPC